MPQISKQVMSQDAWDMMWGRLVDVFRKTKTSREAALFLDGLLTPTEKQMISKRIMVGFLVLSDWDAYSIARVLKLSTATVYKLKNYLDLNNEYRKFIEGILPEKIPFKGFEEIPTTSSLVKLINNIFEGRRKRSKLLYA